VSVPVLSSTATSSTRTPGRMRCRAARGDHKRDNSLGQNVSVWSGRGCTCGMDHRCRPAADVCSRTLLTFPCTRPWGPVITQSGLGAPFPTGGSALPRAPARSLVRSIRSRTHMSNLPFGWGPSLGPIRIFGRTRADSLEGLSPLLGMGRMPMVRTGLAGSQNSQWR
jgi:hypothetical protein